MAWVRGFFLVYISLQSAGRNLIESIRNFKDIHFANYFLKPAKLDYLNLRAVAWKWIAGIIQ